MGGNSLLRIFCFFVVGILFGASVVWGQIKDKIEAGCEKTNNKIPKGLIDTVYKVTLKELFATFSGEPELSWCYNYVLPLIGNVTNDDQPKSPFTSFTLGYHTLGIPAVDFWSETRDFFDNLRPPLVAIREAIRETALLSKIATECKDTWLTAINNNNDTSLQSKKNCTLYTRGLLKCLHWGNTVVEDLVRPVEDKWVDRLYKACHLSLSVITEVFYRSVAALFYNGRKAKWDYSPFRLMYEDTLEYVTGVHERVSKTFPDYITNLTNRGLKDEAAFLQARLDDILDRLYDPSLPYHHLYKMGNIKALQKDWLFGINGNGKGYVPFAKEVRTLRETIIPYEARWRKDNVEFITDLYDAPLLPNGHFDFNKSTVANFKDWILFDVYKTYLEVDVSSEPAYDGPEDNRVLVGDGRWDWQPDKNGLHSMRLAWDLMGAVLEELKCYMKDTYYFDLRQQAIRATQNDLEAGALFSGISFSILQPCRLSYNNEVDLVTKYCTAENHEICAPISPFQSQQRPESEHHGGLALLKPRWIYKVDEKTGICKGRKDYISMMYACRCGFRLDCGDDLGEQITCQLENNDLLRGQCRGGVAYPCKTLPLAPGKHNETCSSGYCHMKKNSCENKPYKYRKHSGGISTMKLVSLNRFLIQLVGALVAARNGGIIIINL